MRPSPGRIVDKADEIRLRRRSVTGPSPDQAIPTRAASAMR
jgi:hypothetical protein